MVIPRAQEDLHNSTTSLASPASALVPPLSRILLLPLIIIIIIMHVT